MKGDSTVCCSLSGSVRMNGRGFTEADGRWKLSNEEKEKRVCMTEMK